MVIDFVYPNVCLHTHTSQGGGEKLSDEDLEGVLDKVVKLLAYISDKDLFAEFYRKKLARRWAGACVFLVGVQERE